MIWITHLGELYTSEKFGNDDSGDGTESKPFKTILQAMRHAAKEPFPVIYVDSKTEGEVRIKYVVCNFFLFWLITVCSVWKIIT